MNKKNIFRSVGFALSGLFELIKTERNIKIHIVAVVFVVILGFVQKISVLEWVAVVLVSGLVISLEAINTSFEKLCDLYTTERNPQIKSIKDLAAAAVLLAAITAVFVAFIIFVWPIL